MYVQIAIHIFPFDIDHACIMYSYIYTCHSLCFSFIIHSSNLTKLNLDAGALTRYIYFIFLSCWQKWFVVVSFPSIPISKAQIDVSIEWLTKLPGRGQRKSNFEIIILFGLGHFYYYKYFLTDHNLRGNKNLNNK